jgi:predicted nuclease of predicted toxin-antitoxin system
VKIPFPILLDESVPEDIAHSLRSSEPTVSTVAAEKMSGRDDTAVIERAQATGRVVVTQDAGFGRLALLQGKRCRGIIILRPGHLQREVILDTLDRLFSSFPPVEEPFLIIVTRRGNDLHVRPRSLR